MKPRVSLTLADTSPAANPARAGRRGGGFLKETSALTGLVIGLLTVVIAIGLSGSPSSFVNLPSILIVFGGTLSAVAVGFTPRELRECLWAIGRSLRRVPTTPSNTAIRVLRLNEVVRREGVLSIQRHLPALADAPFLQKGMLLVADGMNEEEIELILHQDMQATHHRETRSAQMLRRAAEYAPAMGLIGTLIGLVQMLGELDDPATIGPAMAVALLTTLYGAVLANLVLSPLATKLERDAGDAALINLIYLMAAVSASRQENPRLLETRLNSVLPPAERVRYFD